MDASQWTSGLTRRKAFTLRGGNGDVEIVDSPIDERDLKLRDFEALVAPRRTGICGSVSESLLPSCSGARKTAMQQLILSKLGLALLCKPHELAHGSSCTNWHRS